MKSRQCRARRCTSLVRGLPCQCQGGGLKETRYCLLTHWRGKAGEPKAYSSMCCTSHSLSRLAHACRYCIAYGLCSRPGAADGCDHPAARCLPGFMFRAPASISRPRRNTAADDVRPYGSATGRWQGALPRQAIMQLYLQPMERLTAARSSSGATRIPPLPPRKGLPWIR